MDPDEREVWWVSRAKENMAHKVKKSLTKGVKGIIEDQFAVLKNAKHKASCYDAWRRGLKLTEMINAPASRLKKSCRGVKSNFLSFSWWGGSWLFVIGAWLGGCAARLGVDTACRGVTTAPCGSATFCRGMDTHRGVSSTLPRGRPTFSSGEPSHFVRDGYRAAG